MTMNTTAKDYREELIDNIRRELDLFADSCESAIDHADARRLDAEDRTADTEERLEAANRRMADLEAQIRARDTAVNYWHNRAEGKFPVEGRANG